MLVGQSVGNEIDEHIALSFIFGTFGHKEQVSWWCPDDDSRIYQYLYSYTKGSKLQTKAVYSTIYAEAGRPHYILIVQTAPFFDSCHACTVALGGAIFQKVEKHWNLKTLNIAIVAAGSWGNAPTTMYLERIGPDLHGVVVQDGFMAQGVYNENLHIIGPVGDRLEQLFFFFDASGEDRGNCGENRVPDEAEGNECYQYDATVNYLPGPHANYFDIEVIKQGTQPEGYSKNVPFKTVHRFRFNGCAYALDPKFNISDDKPFYVQVAAFEKYKAAKTLIGELNKKGFPSYCEFHDSEKGQSFFRVRIGKFSSAAEAHHMLSKIKPSGYEGFVSKMVDDH